MPATHEFSTKPWWVYIFTHNPFYMISAVLTLYGFHLSFGDNIDPTRGWLQLQFFVGYMILLAATGVLVVYLGKVWEDARTLFLLLLLLMVALSVSFDRVCLDNEYVGLRFLSISLGFCLSLSETLLRSLRIQLPWRYRGILYLQLAILFLYPPWLGHLSLTNQLAALGWYAMGFPTIMAISVVLLLPAASKRAIGLRNNGTPWRWPWYPWTIFVVLGIGIVLRALTISLSFDPTKGFHTGFQAYFLIPLLLAIMLIVAEHSIGRRSQRAWWRFVVMPLGLLGLALPGTPTSIAQSRYLELLRDTIGAPIQITAVLLIAFFFYLFCKRVRSAEWGIVACLAVLTVVDHNTVNLSTLTWFNPIPALLCVLTMVTSAVLRRNTVRLFAATLGVMTSVTYALGDTEFVNYRGYVPVHLTIVMLVLLGLVYEDWLGRFIRRYATTLLAFVALLSLLTYRHLFPDVATPWHALCVICLGVTAALYWQQNCQFRDLLSLVACFSIATGHLLEHYIGGSLNLLVLQGRKWLAWGALFFLVGLIVSFIKGGQFLKFFRTLQKWDATIQQSPKD